MARLSFVPDPVPQECLSAEERATRPLNRTRVLANAPDAAAGVARLADALGGSKTLDPLVKAVAVLAVVRRSPYETRRNLAAAIQQGLDEDLAEAFEEEDWTHPSLTDAQRAAFRYAMLFDSGHGVQNEVFKEVQAHLSEAEIAELSVVCIHFGGLARVAIALGVEPEAA